MAGPTWSEGLLCGFVWVHFGDCGVKKLMWPWKWRGPCRDPGRALNPSFLSLLPSLPLSPGPLRSMVEDLQSEESDEDDSSSGEEAAGKTNAGRDSRCPGWWGVVGIEGILAALLDL